MITTDLHQAVAILRAGKLVAFPTETVYGLGADANNPQAVAKIYTAKGRPLTHPVIVHIPDINHLQYWAREIPASAWQLGKAFWPGPLTLILKKSDQVSNTVTGNQDTIGLRVPAHPIAHKLLIEFGGGIAAPSANRFGELSPTTAQHVQDSLADDVDLILDGGACAVGIESTIIDLSSSEPRLLRPGAISISAIENILGSQLSTSQKNSPRAPGMLASHYAPHTSMKIIESANLIAIIELLLQQGKNIGVLSFNTTPIAKPQVTWIMMSQDIKQYSHDLYAILHAVDSENHDVILVEQPPQTEEWLAVNDRLNKAAG